MVYKKYIKRNGKIYGPYIYHSKRIDGKVVSEYRGGLKRPKNYINFLLIIGSLIVVGLLIFLLAFSRGEGSISGQAVLDLNANYKQGEILKGKLDLSLKEGEFIPADSKIVFENNGEKKEFLLRDITSREVSDGNFYIQGKNLDGSGQGYGFEGSSEEYKGVYFELNIYKEDTTQTQENEESQIEPEEETTEEESVVEEEVTEIEEIVEEEPTEEIIEEQATETEPEVNEDTQTEVEFETEQEETETEPVSEPETETGTEMETTPITGNFFARITGFVFGINPTGQATLELEKTVEGKVSFGEEFVYELQAGESAELKPLSVKTDSEGLDDNEVKVKVDENKVIVTTNYNEKEKGFGEEFLGEDSFRISVNLDDLNLNAEEGELKIRIVYEGSEILEIDSYLIGEEVITEEPESAEEQEEPVEEINETEENETIIEDVNETIELNVNETNVTIDVTNESFSIISVEPLGIREKALLLGYFGDIPVEVVKSELFKDRIIVGYKLGEYEVEFSYDSSISPELLEKAMENDRTIWLRDLSKSLSSGGQTSGQEINVTNESYSF